MSQQAERYRRMGYKVDPELLPRDHPLHPNNYRPPRTGWDKEGLITLGIFFLAVLVIVGAIFHG